MARKLKSDKGLFLAVLFLVCVSAVMVCSASAAAALQNELGRHPLPVQAERRGSSPASC